MAPAYAVPGLLHFMLDAGKFFENRTFGLHGGKILYNYNAA